MHNKATFDDVFIMIYDLLFELFKPEGTWSHSCNVKSCRFVVLWMKNYMATH